MKKSHEYDSPVLSRLVSVVTVLAICVCSICTIVTASKISTLTASTGTVISDNSGSSNNGGNGGTNNGGTNNNGGNNGSTNNGGTTNNGGSQDATPSGDGNTADTPDDSQGGETPAEPAGPTNEEILNKYNEVVQNLKDNVSEYHKKEFQRMADEYDMGSIGGIVIPIANGLMTSESKADDQVRTDKEQIPVIGNAKATIAPLTADNIKSATMTENGGKTTIVIVLNDEVDCMPAETGAATAPSFHGGMFNPISKSGIDDILTSFESVADINHFSLTYNNCTATLVFDTASLKVDSLEQIMNVRIDVNANVKGFLSFVAIDGYATIINTMRVNQITYK